MQEIEPRITKAAEKKDKVDDKTQFSYRHRHQQLKVMSAGDQIKKGVSFYGSGAG
jgi:hypothetical protein